MSEEIVFIDFELFRSFDWHKFLLTSIEILIILSWCAHDILETISLISIPTDIHTLYHGNNLSHLPTDIRTLTMHWLLLNKVQFQLENWHTIFIHNFLYLKLSFSILHPQFHASITDIILQTSISFKKTPVCCHFFMVGGLHTSMTLISMLAGVYTPGRAFQARQVEGYRSDKVAAQSLLSLYFPIFLPFTFQLS